MLKKKNFLTLLVADDSAYQNCFLDSFLELALFLVRYEFILSENKVGNYFFKRQISPLGDMSTQNPNGARYLDPKYSRWISVYPALGEYVPAAGKSNEADKLPGMGGIFNSVNLSLYHYGGNNPIKYVDPDGRVDINSGQSVGINIAIQVLDTWIPSYEPTKSYYGTSAFTEGFKSEYDIFITQKAKVVKTVGAIGSSALCLINPYAGIPITAAQILYEKCVPAFLSDEIIAENPFSYLRTAEFELDRLEYFINNSESLNLNKSHLITQRDLLKSEYYLNKLQIYSNYIPTCEAQYYGEQFESLCEKIDNYEKQWNNFSKTYASGIEFWQLDSQGTVLPDKCIDYLRYKN